MRGSAAIDILETNGQLEQYVLPRRMVRPVTSSTEDQAKTVLLRNVIKTATSSATGNEEVRKEPPALALIKGSADTAQIDSAYAEALVELNRYADYPARWDGYRAKPFDHGVLARAKAILAITKQELIKEQTVPRLLTTGPASDGSLDIEIREGSRTLFYTIYSEVDIEVVAIIEGTTPAKRKIPFDETALAQWVDWVVGKMDISKILADNSHHT
jgi:hypothetical protein